MDAAAELLRDLEVEPRVTAAAAATLADLAVSGNQVQAP